MLLIYGAVSTERFRWVKEKSKLFFIEDFFIGFLIMTEVFWWVILDLLGDKFSEGFNNKNLGMHIFEKISFVLLIDRVRYTFSSISECNNLYLIVALVDDSNGTYDCVYAWLMVFLFELSFELVAEIL